MKEGRIATTLTKEEATQERILEAAMGSELTNNREVAVEV